MDVKISKERTHLFSPNINIGVMVQITGGVELNLLESAISRAVSNNEILKCKIRIADDGDAYYSVQAKPRYSFSVTNLEWQEIIKQQERIPFQLKQGELIRFFAIPQDNFVRLVIVAHHLAGDGLSFSYLLEDIMNALAGNPLTYKPLQLWSTENKDEYGKLNLFLRFMMSRLNKKWNKSGKIFSFEDYERMFHTYWTEREAAIFTHNIYKGDLTKLLELSKAHSVTLNSTITTAFIKTAKEKSDVGMAVSIRPEGYSGMGNYASGISIQYTYDHSKGFWENAQVVHSLIYDKLNNHAKKYFLLQFMSGLAPTLIDAAYFAAFDGYSNKAAKTMQKMFGYNGNPKAISLTNLTKLNIPAQYGEYALSDFTMVPPLVPNGKRVIGVATLEETLTISMRVEKNTITPSEKVFFENAIQELLSDRS